MNNKYNYILIIIPAILVIVAIYLYQLPVIYGTIFNIRNILVYVIMIYTLGITSYFIVKSIKIKPEHHLKVKSSVFAFVTVMMLVIGRVQIYYLEEYVIPKEIGCTYYDKYDNLIYETALLNDCPSLNNMMYEIDNLEEVLTFDVTEYKDSKNQVEIINSTVEVTYDIHMNITKYDIQSRYEKEADDLFVYEGLKRKTSYEYEREQVTQTNEITVYQELSDEPLEDIYFYQYPTNVIAYKMKVTDYDTENTEFFKETTTSYGLDKYIYIDDELNSHFDIATGTREEYVFNDDTFSSGLSMTIYDTVPTYEDGILYKTGVQNKVSIINENNRTTKTYTITRNDTEHTLNSSSFDNGPGYELIIDDAYDTEQVRIFNEEQYYIEEEKTSILSTNNNYSKIEYFDTSNTYKNVCDVTNNDQCNQADIFITNEPSFTDYITSSTYENNQTNVNINSPLFLIQNDYMTLYTKNKRSPLNIEQANKLFYGFHQEQKEVSEERAMMFLESFDFESLLLYGYQSTTFSSNDNTFIMHLFYQRKDLYDLYLNLGTLLNSVEINQEALVKEHGVTSELTLLIGREEDKTAFPIDIMYIETDSGSFSGSMIDIGDYSIAQIDTASDGFFRIIYNNDGSNYYGSNVTSNIEGITSFTLGDDITFSAIKEYLGITMTVYHGDEEVVKVHQLDTQYNSSSSSAFYGYGGYDIDFENFGDYSYNLKDYKLYNQTLFLDSYIIDNTLETDRFIQIILSEDNNYTFVLTDDELPNTYTYSYDSNYPDMLKVVVTNDNGVHQEKYYHLNND